MSRGDDLDCGPASEPPRPELAAAKSAQVRHHWELGALVSCPKRHFCRKRPGYLIRTFRTDRATAVMLAVTTRQPLPQRTPVGTYPQVRTHAETL